jgi:tetratricopeptide (TPR) repeat protein
MLITASDLGYTPSTLTVLRATLAISRGGPEDPKFRSYFRSTLDRLNRLVQVGDDPDALTLHGLLRLRAGNDARALGDFDRAIEAGRRAGDAYVPAPSRNAVEEATRSNDTVSRRRRPKWTYESDCYLERGNILLRKGNLAAALTLFRVAAFELDSSAAYLQLAKLLPADSNERQECLLKSAVSGSGEAYRLLSKAETAKSHEAGSDKGVAEEHMRWAAEWELLGGLRSQ